MKMGFSNVWFITRSVGPEAWQLQVRTRGGHGVSRDLKFCLAARPSKWVLLVSVSGVFCCANGLRDTCQKSILAASHRPAV